MIVCGCWGAQYLSKSMPAVSVVTQHVFGVLHLSLASRRVVHRLNKRKHKHTHNCAIDVTQHSLGQLHVVGVPAMPTRPTDARLLHHDVVLLDDVGQVQATLCVQHRVVAGRIARCRTALLMLRNEAQQHDE